MAIRKTYASLPLQAWRWAASDLPLGVRHSHYACRYPSGL